MGTRSGVISYQVVTIANGASLSDEVNLKNVHVLAIVMPAAWTAANLTFTGRPGYDQAPNEALQDVYDASGNEITVTAAAARYIVLTGTALDALFALSTAKVRSGTTGTPVAQGAERKLALITVPIT